MLWAILSSKIKCYECRRIVSTCEYVSWWVCCEEKFEIFFLIAYSNLSFTSCVCVCVCNKQTASWYFCSDFSLILFGFFHPSVCFLFPSHIQRCVFLHLTIHSQIHSLSSVSSFFFFALFMIPKNQKRSNNNFKQKLSREKRATDFLENRLDLWVGFMVCFFHFYFSNDCKE